MVKLLFCLLAIVAVSCSLEPISDAVELVQETADGTIGCKFWRVRSITDTPGQWWQVRELEFYSSTDGSGEKASPVKAMASTYKGDLNTSPNKAEKAIDGQKDTFWSTSDKYKFEWIGVEFAEPQDIRSIKMELTSEFMGPAMVIVEKSFDGEWWSRSTEISNMKEWGTTMQLYPLITMDTVPTSLFAFRSQENPRFCVGVKPTPHATDPKADPYPLADDATLEVQICDDNTNTQYWQLGQSRPMLKNAADQAFVIHINGTAGAGAKLSVKQCRDGCEDFTEDVWTYGAESDGGLLRNKNQPELVMVPKAGALEEGAEVELQVCGSQGNTASIAECSGQTQAQWELLPMFVLEEGKQTVACAPYSHDNVEPGAANTRVEAQEVCAKDPDCAAYNWVGADAEQSQKNIVYACTGIHEVHSGVQGWELGIRAGRLEPFTELMNSEKTETRTWTMYADM